MTKYFSSIEILKGNKVIEQRKVTVSDVETFSKLTGDLNSVHFGEKAIVHGVLINGFVSAILGTKLPGPGYVVTQQTMTFPNPCKVGDDVEILVEILEARKIVECRFVCTSLSQKNVVHEGVVKLVKMKHNK